MALESNPGKSESAAGSSPFLNQLKEKAVRHGHADDDAEAVVAWCRRFILFHNKRHPQEMGLREVAAFLEVNLRPSRDGRAGAPSGLPAECFCLVDGGCWVRNCPASPC